jgi:hypothetical protein
MRINPLEKHGGMSYFDVVLLPLAQAMRDTLREGTYVRGARVCWRVCSCVWRL